MKRLLLAALALLLSHEPSPVEAPATRPTRAEILRAFDAGVPLRELAARHGMTLSEATRAIRSERKKARR